MHLVVLDDDRHYFPPYDAVPVVRPAVFQRWPCTRDALLRLAGQISADDMRAMNYAVDGQKQDAAVVVTAFLKRRGLIA